MLNTCYVLVGLPLGLGMTSGLLAQVRDGGPKSEWYKVRRAELALGCLSSYAYGVPTTQNQVGPAGQPPKWAFGPVWTILYCGKSGLELLAFYTRADYKSLSRTAMGFASHLAIRAHDAALTPSAT